MGRECVLSKKSERQEEGKRKTRDAIYRGGKRDIDIGRYEK